MLQRKKKGEKNYKGSRQCTANVINSIIPHIDKTVGFDSVSWCHCKMALYWDNGQNVYSLWHFLVLNAHTAWWKLVLSYTGPQGLKQSIILLKSSALTAPQPSLTSFSQMTDSPTPWTHFAISLCYQQVGLAHANEISFQALISNRGWPAEFSDLARLPAGAPISSALPQHLLCVALQISSGPARYPVQPAWISTPLNLAPRDSLCSTKRRNRERREGKNPASRYQTVTDACRCTCLGFKVSPSFFRLFYITAC